jgi:hypothetical protein
MWSIWTPHHPCVWYSSCAFWTQGESVGIWWAWILRMEWGIRHSKGVHTKHICWNRAGILPILLLMTSCHGVPFSFSILIPPRMLAMKFMVYLFDSI